MTNRVRWMLHLVVATFVVGMTVAEWHRWHSGADAIAIAVFSQVALSLFVELIVWITRRSPDDTLSNHQVSLPQSERLQQAWLGDKVDGLMGEEELNARTAFDALNLPLGRRIVIITQLFLDRDDVPVDTADWIDALKHFEGETPEGQAPKLVFHADELERFITLLLQQRLRRTFE